MVGTRSWSRFAALALLATSQHHLLAQAAWSETFTSGGPSGRSVHSGAYDLMRQRFVTFGGFDPTYSPQATTWEFDGRDWLPVAPAHTPPPRAGHAMAYDQTRGRVVLFGGTTSIFANVTLQDTWEFDGADWTLAPTAVRPAARFDAAMAFDVTAARIVLFGGRTDLTTPLGDTWLWSGLDWVPAATTGPWARAKHALSHDLLRQRTVLFGGWNGGGLGDTWEWDGSLWHAVATSGPTARSGHAMAFDYSRGVTVLHGGQPGGAETWEWDGSAWNAQASAALARADHAMVFDARLQRTMLFGGLLASPAMIASDVHTFALPRAGSYLPQGASCPGTAGLPRLFEPNAVATGPMIGQTSTLQVTQVLGHTFFAFGMSNALDGSTPLPLSLAAIGMPGCELLVSRDAITSVAPQFGAATLQVAVPPDPFLAGMVFYVQAFPVDLLANPMGFLTTNALAATIGRL